MIEMTYITGCSILIEWVLETLLQTAAFSEENLFMCLIIHLTLSGNLGTYLLTNVNVDSLLWNMFLIKGPFQVFIQYHACIIQGGGVEDELEVLPVQEECCITEVRKSLSVINSVLDIPPYITEVLWL